MQTIIAISDVEYSIHRTIPPFRFSLKSRYPREIQSGRPIKEYVALTDAYRRLGLQIIPIRDLERALSAGESVIKFGRTDIRADIEQLARLDNDQSEWNHNNLEKVLAWTDYLDLGRQTWNLWLDMSEHRELLRELFEQHGRLFLKTAAKGYAGICENHREFEKAFPDASILCEESKNLIVSEVMEIREIEAERFDSRERMTDEWRHHVYANQLVSTTHAFDCNPKRTDASGMDGNRLKAMEVIDVLASNGFASSYVLDTCTLASGGTAVVEVNNLFASGIYDRTAVKLLAKAVAEG